MEIREGYSQNQCKFQQAWISLRVFYVQTLAQGIGDDGYRKLLLKSFAFKTNQDNRKANPKRTTISSNWECGEIEDTESQNAKLLTIFHSQHARPWRRVWAVWEELKPIMPSAHLDNYRYAHMAPRSWLMLRYKPALASSSSGYRWHKCWGGNLMPEIANFLLSKTCLPFFFKHPPPSRKMVYRTLLVGLVLAAMCTYLHIWFAAGQVILLQQPGFVTTPLTLFMSALLSLSTGWCTSCLRLQAELIRRPQVRNKRLSANFLKHMIILLSIYTC